MEKVIIYLIIGIGYVIYNYYKKLNVPKSNSDDYSSTPIPTSQSEQNQNPPIDKPYHKDQERKNDSPSKSLEELLREFDTNTYDSEKKVIDHQQDYDKKINKDYSYKEEGEIAYNNEGLGKLDDSITELDLSEKEVGVNEISTYEYDYDNHNNSKKNNHKIDLKKAIVYDAILKRPQF